jgi:hypothetical protein
MKNLLIILFFLMSATAGFAQAKQEPKLADAYAHSLFRSADGIYFDLEQDPAAASINSYFNILDWLQGRVAGLQVYTLRSGIKVPVMRNSLAAIYIDDIRYDASVLNSLSVHDIAGIKVMKTPGLFTGPGGAIAFYTKRGESEEA